MAYEDATPGTSFSGPLQVTAPEGETDYTALPTDSKFTDDVGLAADADAAIAIIAPVVAALLQRLR